jgi:hypothetical protein
MTGARNRLLTRAAQKRTAQKRTAQKRTAQKRAALKLGQEAGEARA